MTKLTSTQSGISTEHSSKATSTGAPTGTASGDLSGTFPGPTVAKVLGGQTPVTNPATADVSMGSHRLTKVSDPIASTDALTLRKGDARYPSTYHGAAPVIQFGRIQYSPMPDPTDVAQRGYSVIVGQTGISDTTSDTHNVGASDVANIAAIRALTAAASGPPCKILMYRIAIENTGDPNANTLFTRPANNQAGWYLRDNSGNPYASGSFAGGHPQMDIGNVPYQNAAITRAIAMCLAAGYDGIFIDNVLANPIANGYYTTNLPATGTLSTDPLYNAAWDSFLANCKTQFDAAGLTVVAGNAGGTLQNANTAPIHIAHLDAGMDMLLDEQFSSGFSTGAGVFFPATTATPTIATNSIQLMQHAEAVGKTVLLHSYVQGVQNGGNNLLVFNMAVATALLGGGGNTCFIVDNGSDSDGTGSHPYNSHYTQRAAGPWQTLYDKARAVGRPLGPMYVSGGVWRRDFTNGFVLVNDTNGALTEPISNIVIGSHVANIYLAPRYVHALTYGTTVTPDGGSVAFQTLRVTNATAFTIAAPVAPPGSEYQEFTIEVNNASGGAMGAITWDAAYLFPTGAWANPANTKKRFAKFAWNSNNWLCTVLATADY